MKINNLKIQLIRCLFSLVFMMTVTTIQVGAQSPMEVVKFDFEGTAFLTDKIAGLIGVAISPVLRTTGHDNTPNSAVKFTSTITPSDGSIVLPPTLAQFLDPKGDGYTINCWVNSESTTAIDHQIFWGTASGSVLAGIKQQKGLLRMDRYIDWVSPTRYWTMSTWTPDLFATTGGWHHIFYAVKQDMIRIKVYQPGEDSVNGHWGTDGYGGHVELIYMGGQSMEKITQFGLGAVGQSSAIQSIDDFLIYDKAMNFKQMDSIYMANYLARSSVSASGRSALAEIVTSIEEPATNISVYPNPTSGEVHILTSSVLPNAELSLIDQLGHVLIKVPFDKASADLNIQSVPQGLYFLRIRSNTRNAVYKIIKTSDGK